jgi:polyhydroxyalkanoate synthesis regulator phasin
MLEEANVSLRAYEQMKMMMKIDRNILNDFGKRHSKQHTSKNLHDNFVDFTRLPLDKLSKDAKSLLYRPQKMKVLYDGYQRLAMVVRSNAMRKLDRTYKRDMDKIHKFDWEPRQLEKLPSEIELGEKLWNTIDTWIKAGKARQDAAGQKYDPVMKVATKDSEHWGEMLLERLLRERREMSKEERLLKFRNDSVDEVDTTDLENWSLKKRER